MAEQTRTAPVPLRRVIAAAGIGNFVEWFDFSLYGFLAPVLAAQFFPNSDPAASLLATFAVFGLAFFVRPLGALYFGRMGDRIGRRTTLSVIVLLMSGATALIGLLPTYATIGVFAPVLLLLLRLVQGFSAGGEFTGASVLIVEYAPRHRRGLYMSALSISTFAASALGVVITAALTSGFGVDAMQAWGWRALFLLSLPLGLVGLYLRLKVEETPEFKQLEHAADVEQAPLAEALRTQRKPIVTLFVLLLINSVAFYVLGTYWPTFLSANAGMSRTDALWSSAAAYCVLIATAPLHGYLADRFGRKPMMVYATVGFVVVAIPAFLLSVQGAFWTAFLGQALFALMAGAMSPVNSLITAELFPPHVRYSSGAIGQNLAYLIFGGTAPYVCTFLISATGSGLSPAIYITVVAAISALGAIFLLRETRPVAEQPRERAVEGVS